MKMFEVTIQSDKNDIISVIMYACYQEKIPTFNQSVDRLIQNHPEYVYTGQLFRGHSIDPKSLLNSKHLDLAIEVSGNEYRSWAKSKDAAYIALSNNIAASNPYDMCFYVLAQIGSGIDISAVTKQHPQYDVDDLFHILEEEHEVLATITDKVSLVGFMFDDKWYERNQFNSFVSAIRTAHGVK